MQYDSLKFVMKQWANSGVVNTLHCHGILLLFRLSICRLRPQRTHTRYLLAVHPVRPLASPIRSQIFKVAASAAEVIVWLNVFYPCTAWVADVDERMLDYYNAHRPCVPVVAFTKVD